MRILVKIPTRFRKEKFFNTLDKFYELSSDLLKLSFLITLDSDDKMMNNDDTKKRFTKYNNLNFVYGTSTSKLNAANRDLENYQDWDIILLGSDDTVPVVKGYDEVIRNKMKEYYPDTDGTLHFNDGFQKSNLNTFPILK
jgi:hypothetical protein